MKNSFMKSKFYLILILMLIIAGGTSYFAYAEYKEYKGDKSPTVSSNSSVESDKSINTQQDLSDYPVGVQKGYVSVEYFDIVLDFQLKSNEYNEKRDELMNGKISINLHPTELIEYEMDFLKYINRINYKVTTKQELEIDEYVSSAIYYQKQRLENMLKYHDTKEYVYFDLADDMSDNFVSNWKIAYDIMSDYQITK